MAVRDLVRGRIASAVGSRVAGPDSARRVERIYRSPGPRWFTPDDPIWQVHCDPAMYIGGIRALLVQSLHPLAMAGVAGHSGFRGDPWGRLQRTSKFIAMTTYGRVADAEALLAAVRGIHDGVSGVDERGRAYAASDPHLLRWVHIAETDAFLAAFMAYGPRRLSPQEADTYVSQMGSISERLGVGDLPHTVAELDSAVAAYRPELEQTPAALDTVDFLLRDPPLPAVARLGYAVLAAGAVAITPPWARALLGIGPGGRAGPLARAGPVARAGARSMTALLRQSIDHPAHEPRPPDSG